MANATPKEISTELREFIEAAVEDAIDRRLQDLLGDPDEGLEVREEVLQRLKEQQRRVAAGERGRSFEDVVKELGLQ